MKYNDSLTYTGANNLAKKITEYWRVRGYAVKTFVEEASLGGEMRVFIVRSDLVNGYPQRKLPFH